MRKISCPQCGHFREETDRTCLHCGSRMNQAEFMWFYEIEHQLRKHMKKLDDIHFEFDGMKETFRQNYIDDLDNGFVSDPRAIV